MRGGESAVEQAQRAFRAALCGAGALATATAATQQLSSANKHEEEGAGKGKPERGKEEKEGGGGGYKRTDKINYEFEGYDLAFASFERMR